MGGPIGPIINLDCSCAQARFLFPPELSPSLSTSRAPLPGFAFGTDAAALPSLRLFLPTEHYRAYQYPYQHRPGGSSRLGRETDGRLTVLDVAEGNDPLPRLPTSWSSRTTNPRDIGPSHAGDLVSLVAFPPSPSPVSASSASPF